MGAIGPPKSIEHAGGQDRGKGTNRKLEAVQERVIRKLLGEGRTVAAAGAAVQGDLDRRNSGKAGWSNR